MTGKPTDGGEDVGGAESSPPRPPASAEDSVVSPPFGRNRVELPSAAEPPHGPRFPTPPPAHPILTELHTLWIEADADSIRRIVHYAREQTESAPPEIRRWVVYYVEALERLEYWLRDY